MARFQLLLAGWALCTMALSEPSSGPPISAQIQSNWPAADHVTQFLESVAIEKRSALFPFLRRISLDPLTSAPFDNLPAHDQMQLADNSIPTSPLSSWAGLAPAQLHEKLTKALAETELLSTPETESMAVSLAMREGSVAVEAFRQLWLQDEKASEGAQAGGECESFVRVAGAKVCSVEEFWTAVGVEQKEAADPLKITKSSTAPPTVYSIDHLLPSTDSPHLPLLVLYGTPTHPSFAPLFLALHALAAPSSGSARIQLALRWKPISSSSADEASKMVLSGYGAHLDIKKMDYLTIDDRAKKAGAAKTSKGDATAPRIYAVPSESVELLSAAFAQHIIDSPSPLDTFSKGTGVFPLLAPALGALTQISEQLLTEVSYNQATKRAASQPSFSINGLPQPINNDLDPFLLLRVLRKERGVMQDLLALSPNLTGSAARELLIAGSKPTGSASGLDAMLGDLFDARDVVEGGDLTLWWNDLEKDARYRGWPTALREVLRPSYAGQLAQIARNINNVVLSFNLAQPDQLKFIADYVSQYVSRSIPIRFGIVPIVADEGKEKDDAGTAVALAMWHLVETVGRSVTIKFLGELAQTSPYGGPITLGHLAMSYDRFVRIYTSSREVEGPLAPNLDTLLKDHFDQSRIGKARDWATRLGVSEGGRAGQGSLFLNGACFALDDEFTQNLQRTLSAHFQYVQQKVYLGELTEDVEAADYFSTLPSTRPRRNAWIFPSEERPLRVVNVLYALGAELWTSLSWTTKDIEQHESHVSLASVLVVTDLTKPSGIKLAQEALDFVGQDERARLALIHNPGSYTGLGIGVDELPEVMGEAGQHAYDLSTRASGRVAAAFELPPGANAIVVNGRVVGPFEDYALTAADISSLIELEIELRITCLVKAIGDSLPAIASLDPPALSDLYALAGSIVHSANAPDLSAGMFAPSTVERRRDYLLLEGGVSCISTGDKDGAVFEIGVVVDPATELAQRWAPILLSLSKLDSVYLKLYLNPALELREMPIKRFYSFSFPLSLAFDDAGQEVNPGIKFAGLPEDVLFTLGLETHRSWLTFPFGSLHDLDNIRLADLGDGERKEGVSALFELENVLVEGHARETVGMKPPRGLQVELLPVDFVETGSRPDASVQSDTIVMSNLGYFQLKAKPGPWRLALRPGKPTEVYSVDSVGAEGWKSGAVDQVGDSLLVGTLEGLTLYPRVRRNPGHEKTDLLAPANDQEEENKGLFGKVKGAWGSLVGDASKAVQAAGKKQAEVNVFTVASGLLYERMALLMMVSVMRHTQSTVKFWLITNFLSPAFKEFLPEVANEYGFDYELVTYQWPHWLRAQKEKQRTIWGYKILFLDVLFPLDLKRVIFVDSDQIVRADLQELVDLDLQGAPYAYAPMGDSRPEMEGFRFWKTGYWATHLGESPYHISALYVIDLLRFRQMAAGDLLRQQYQQLSADPNSLANLDQDLPNNMQRVIPIFTLSPDWLWCETWCDDESLRTAKTIDLCNNPLTKEPKLDRARRQIPEWTIYDDEVAALAQRVAERREGTKGNAFVLRADELGQAVQQKQEREEVLEKERKHEEL